MEQPGLHPDVALRGGDDRGCLNQRRQAAVIESAEEQEDGATVAVNWDDVAGENEATRRFLLQENRQAS